MSAIRFLDKVFELWQNLQKKPKETKNAKNEQLKANYFYALAQKPKFEKKTRKLAQT